MINTDNTNAEWRPRFAPPTSNTPPTAEAFRLSDDPQTAPDDGFAAFGDDGFTLLDAVDIINPLQQLPIVGSIYRELTGDTLDPFSRVAGSTLFFGPIGAAASTANVLMEEFTGKDMGAHMMAFIKNEPSVSPNTSVAEAPSGTHGLTNDTPLAPTAAGTDGMDPVTSWAISEIQHRQAEAEKRGITVTEKTYTALVEQSPAAVKVVADAVRPPSLWSKPLDREEPVIVAENKENTVSVVSNSPAVAQSAAMNAFQAEHRASPETLLRLKQSTAAYQTVTFEPSAREADAPEKVSTPDPLPQPGDKTSTELTHPLNGSNKWFTTSMAEALGKYQAANPADTSTLSKLSSMSSLH